MERSCLYIAHEISLLYSKSGIDITLQFVIRFVQWAGQAGGGVLQSRQAFPRRDNNLYQVSFENVDTSFPWLLVYCRIVSRDSQSVLEVEQRLLWLENP